MAWAWIENGNIFVAYSKDVAPTDAIEVPEGTLPQDVIFENNILRLKTEAEKEEDRKVQELEEAKQELARTDSELIRVIEDIIDVLDLHDKLPQATKNKLYKRKDLRNSL